MILRDHAHGGIQPVLINQRFREAAEKKNPSTAIKITKVESRCCGATAAHVVCFLGKDDFAVEIEKPYVLRPGRSYYLRDVQDFDKDLFLDEMKAMFMKHSVFARDDDVRTAMVMRAWENGPISFYCDGVLFTSDVIKEMVSDHVKELL